MWSKCSWVMRTAFAPARACGSLNALGSITSTAPSLSKRVQACPSLVSRIATPLRIRRCDEHTGIGWAPDGPGALRRAALAPGAAGRAGQVWHRPDRAAGVPDRGGHRAPEHHPGVQRRGGRPGLYIAMRYVPDGDVWTLIDRVGPLPAARACALIAQAASALDAAHARGLVHRDVKPTNMLLEISPRTSRPDHLYLSDFGLAKPSAVATGLTATGQFFGTVDYVAPEQIQGDPLDGRTDQYALACAAFEMLSGSPPFRRENGMAVISAQLSEPPPPLSARVPGLPAAADRVIAKALAKSPADRHDRCLDFAEALLAA